MESTRHTAREINPERLTRDRADQSDEKFVEVGLKADGPLEIHSTDEPGGDPYNHTGNFKRLYR